VQGELLPLDAPKVVWGNRQRAFHQEQGVAVPVAVGAPFLYLLEMIDTPIVTDRFSRDGTIVFPFHGNADTAVAYSHEGYATSLLEREAGNITVCLYKHEYQQEEARSAYSDARFRLTTLGDRHDPMFLTRFLIVTAMHERAVSNRVSTALFYAGYLGCELEMYGPEATIWFEDEENDGNREFRRAVPELFSGPLDQSTAHDLACRELGVHQLKSPTELRDLLGLNLLHRPVVASRLFAATSKRTKQKFVVASRRKSTAGAPT
jgi:hypothetical protein